MASVASRNIFDLLGDSEDTDSVKEKEPPAKEPPVVKKKVDRSRAHPQEKGIRFDYPQRGGHKGSTSNRNEDTRPAPRDRNVGPRLSGRNEEGGGGGGGRGGDYPARSSRGARPNDRERGGRGRGRRGREFDKHSGTGKYDSEKKEAQGWGNPTDSWQNSSTVEPSSWNTETNDNAAASSTWDDKANDTSTSGWTNNTTEEKSDWNADATEEKSEEKNTWGATEETTTDTNNWDQQPESTATWEEGNEGTKTNWEEGVEEPKNEDIVTGDSAPVPEPEEVVKTLDEYRAEQKVLDIPLPEARKPNEGVDDSQWKDAVPLEKDEEEDFIFAGKEQSYRLKNKKNKSKNYLEITQTFVERPGSGSSRGRGRGRGRGSRGGRDDRDGRNNYRDNYDDNNRDNRRRGSGGGRSGHVNLDDQRAFPNLGA